LQIPRQRFDRAAERLGFALMANARAAQGKLDKVAARLRPQALAQDLARRSEKTAQTGLRLKAAMERFVSARLRELAGAARVLESLSHVSVLARGFALVQRPEGDLVRAAGELSAGDAVELVFADGAAPAIVGDSSAPGRRKGKKGGGDQGSLF
jgi:exodeoxyribonuclease VII large subunit